MRVDNKTTKPQAEGQEGKVTIPTIHNVHILDASGSMAGGKYRNAIEGIKAEMEALKLDKNAIYTQTVVEFSSRFKPVTGRTLFNSRESAERQTEHFFMKDISVCGSFNSIGADGGTPLYETVGMIIEKVLAKKADGDLVVVKIFTDGEENTSEGKYTNPVVLKELMDKVQADNHFTITFVGTTFDVERMVRNMGVSRGNTMTHNNTAEDVEEKFRSMTLSTLFYSKSVAGGASANTQSFYAQKEEDKLNQTVKK